MLGLFHQISNFFRNEINFEKIEKSFRKYQQGGNLEDHGKTSSDLCKKKKRRSYGREESKTEIHYFYNAESRLFIKL
jgi:hypothetical protein